MKLGIPRYAKGQGGQAKHKKMIDVGIHLPKEGPTRLEEGV